MTSAIDNRGAGEGSFAAATSSPSAVDHRQKWLRAMEAAGLSDALRNTRAFAGAGQGGSDRDAATERADTSQDGTSRQGKDDSPAGSRSPAERLLVPRQEATAVPPAVDAARHSETKQPPVGGLARGVLVPIGAGEAEAELARAGKGRPAAAEGADKTWAARNLLVLPAEDGGVEIWIRDAKLSGARMQMLLSDLRRAATDIGGGSPRIFINGRPAAPMGEGRTGEGE